MEFYTFLSTDDRHTEIHAVKWIPEKVKAALIITHGIQEYSERYDEFARFLNDYNIAVYAHDHIGHGESVASEEELGTFHSHKVDEVMTADLYQQMNIVIKENPGIPVFMLGHSMGSYVLRKFLSDYGKDVEKIKGAIIMGTGTENNLSIRAGLRLIKGMKRIKNSDYKSRTIAKMAFSRREYKGYDMTGEDPENSWLSKNVKSVKKYYSDPKDTYEVSLDGYEGLMKMTLLDNMRKRIKRIPKNLPILFVSGSEDPVGANGKGVKAAYKKFVKAGIKDVTLKLYKGDRHEILNELDRHDVYEDIALWILSHKRDEEI
ncbi:MAG: alpha/beta fold hydrolase [Erysipelotrichaceae bacterium]|nr:alpha/beta fold hydrolase [Erysipelotrichaceae bacterium]